jgi:hypothetical protein
MAQFKELEGPHRMGVSANPTEVLPKLQSFSFILTPHSDLATFSSFRELIQISLTCGTASNFDLKDRIKSPHGQCFQETQIMMRNSAFQKEALNSGARER